MAGRSSMPSHPVHFWTWKILALHKEKEDETRLLFSASLPCFEILDFFAPFICFFAVALDQFLVLHTQKKREMGHYGYFFYLFACYLL
jgi:hypothetical protein